MLEGRHRMCAVAIAVTAVLGGGQGVAAQEGALPVPARVRVLAPALGSVPVVAKLTGRRGDTLAFDTADRGALVLSLGAVERIEISRGRHAKTLTGAAVGLLVGGAAAGAFLVMFCGGDTLCESDEYVRAFAIIALSPAVAGTLIGSAIRVERWEPVRPDRFVRRGSGPGGVRLAVRLPV